MIQALIGPVTGLLDKFIEDKTRRRSSLTRSPRWVPNMPKSRSWLSWKSTKLKLRLARFSKGGWRPAVGWVCAAAFAYHFVLKDLIVFCASLAGAEIPELPEFDMSTLLTVLGGMLGIGSLRTYEKQKGITK